MVGRLDDWVKVLVERDGIALHPDAANWAGIAVFKRAYGIYQERGYRTRLLAAAYRHRLHWTELVGGDVVLTMPHAWQVRFNASGIDPEPRIDVPVDAGDRRRPAAPLPDFARATSPTASRSTSSRRTARPPGPCAGSSRRTTTSRDVRDIVLPNPDVRRRLTRPALPEHGEGVDVHPPVALGDDADLVFGALDGKLQTTACERYVFAAALSVLVAMRLPSA